MKDALGKTIGYMRASVTDRRDLHCKYYMPYGVECVPGWDILSLEEIRAVGTYAVSLNIRHIKVIGDEPLVRRGRCQLVGQLKSVLGIERVTITTSDVLLERYLDDLTGAGIDDISISLDTLDRDLYQRITGTDALSTVTEIVRRACAMSLSIKINTVSIDFSQMDEEHRRAGQDGWRQTAELAGEYLVDVRFTEMIPIGCDRNFKIINHRELLEEMMKAYPCMGEGDRVHDFGPAVYYRIPGFKGSIGLTSTIYGKFCSGRNQIHLTFQGYLKPCLCYEDGVDLGRILKKGQERPKEEGHYRLSYAGCPSDGELQRKPRKAMKQVVSRKPTAHCFECPGRVTEVHNMITIGG